MQSLLGRLYTVPIATNPNPAIFLSAGEASGDHYGAQLIAALRESLPATTFFGLGGAEMSTEGLDAVVRSESVAHMGITEVIAHMPGVYAKYRRLIGSIRARRPAAAVLIDFPDVNFRLARELKKLNIPVIWFVSPQLWAWKRRRLRWVQQRVSKMLVIFPFEEPFYKNRGVQAEFVGHPLAELPLPDLSREDFAHRNHIAKPAKPQTNNWIALLPGSRMNEVKRNLPEMLRAATILGSSYEYIIPVATTLQRSALAEFIVEHPLASQVHLVDDVRAALYHARVAVVASGTATVQAAVIGNPFIVVYRVSELTYRLAKRLVRYPAEIPADPDPITGDLPVAMVNLIAGRRIVPELLQSQFTAQDVAAALRLLLEDTPARRKQIAALAQVRQLLSPNEQDQTAIQRVRDAVLAHIAPA